jgi:hypothetical protein
MENSRANVPEYNSFSQPSRRAQRDFRELLSDRVVATASDLLTF